jgi:hypothetical protein
MQYNHAVREAHMKTGQKYQCSITDRLDSIHMTPAERAAAKTYLQQGVRAASVILQVLAWSRAVAEQVGRGVRGLARHTH